MRLAGIATALLSICALQAAMPPVPRPAPDFVIHFTNGNEMTLHSLRGKVIALTFVSTTCPHCQHASQVFTKFYEEYGSKGFEPVAVAFNTMANMYVDEFVKNLGIKHPVGFSPVEPVLAFLGISPMERYVVPQIVWIDKKGIIREQTPPLGDEKMLQESHWREMIETLLKEPAETTKHSPTAHVTQAKKSSAQ